MEWIVSQVLTPGPGRIAWYGPRFRSSHALLGGIVLGLLLLGTPLLVVIDHQQHLTTQQQHQQEHGAAGSGTETPDPMHHPDPSHAEPAALYPCVVAPCATAQVQRPVEGLCARRCFLPASWRRLPPLPPPQRFPLTI